MGYCSRLAAGSSDQITIKLKSSGSRSKEGSGGTSDISARYPNSSRQSPRVVIYRDNKPRTTEIFFFFLVFEPTLNFIISNEVDLEKPDTLSRVRANWRLIGFFVFVFFFLVGKGGLLTNS